MQIFFQVGHYDIPITEMGEDKYEALKWAEMCAEGDRSAADYQ